MQFQPDGIEEVRQLFFNYVPEIAEGLIELKGITRIRGLHTLVLVWSTFPEMDTVGASIGVRGIRAKMVVKALSEPLTVVRWSASVKELIGNVFGPFSSQIALHEAEHQATIYIPSDKRAEAEVSRALLSQFPDWTLKIEAKAP